MTNEFNNHQDDGKNQNKQERKTNSLYYVKDDSGKVEYFEFISEVLLHLQECGGEAGDIEELTRDFHGRETSDTEPLLEKTQIIDLRASKAHLTGTDQYPTSS